jgi:hypothetical protein
VPVFDTVDDLQYRGKGRTFATMGHLEVKIAGSFRLSQALKRRYSTVEYL